MGFERRSAPLKGIARLNASNTFTGNNTFSGSNTFTGAPEIQGTQSQLTFIETDATADNGRWRLYANSEQYRIDAVNDANSSATAAIAIDRTGTTIDRMQLNGTEVEVNATFEVNGVSRVRGGGEFRVYDAANDSYLRILHDGDEADIRVEGSTLLNLWGGTEGISLRSASGVSRFQVDDVSSRVLVRDGYELRVQDPSDTEYLRLVHDSNNGVIDSNVGNVIFRATAPGGDFQFYAGGTAASDEALRITDSTDIAVRNGLIFRVYDSSNNSHISVSHDGIDANFTFSGTAGLNIGVPIRLLERAAAVADSPGYGQIWIRNDTPCTLWYTDDAGNDYQISP